MRICEEHRLGGVAACPDDKCIGCVVDGVSRQAKVLLTDVDDMMGALRLVASMEYDRAEVRTIAHLALERLKARVVGA